MNNTSIKSGPAFNSKEVIWDLLEQWKAILIVAILCALIIPGLKYAKDMNSYKAQLANKQAEEAQGTTVSVEEKTEEILSALSDADRSDVLYVLDAKEWIRKQRDYLNESIIMNVDPTNQRTILLDYQISTEDSGAMSSMVYGYLGYLYNEEVLSQVGSVIAPDADSKYVAESISFDRDKYNYIDAGRNTMVLEIRVVAPEDVDLNAVEVALTKCLKDYSKELAESVGNNTIQLLTKTEFRRYNGEAVNNRTNITYSIYNVQNNLRNGASALSDQAKAAIASIEAVQTAEREATATEALSGDDAAAIRTDDPPKPGFSKKYAVLGFILGAALYALCYLLVGILKGKITSAADIGYYGGGRVIGEIYINKEHRGFSKLFCSNLIDKYRYRGKLDTERQLAKAASSIEAICKHLSVDEVSLLCTSKQRKITDTLTRTIAASCKERGIDAVIIPLGDEVEENLLEAVKEGIVLVSRETKVTSLINLMELCKTFDVRLLGNVYIREL